MVTTLGAGQKKHLSSAEAKCPFGPPACHLSRCPWDANEHILGLQPAVSLVAPGQLAREFDQTAQTHDFGWHEFRYF